MGGFKYILVFALSCFLYDNFGVGAVPERLVKAELVFKWVFKSFSINYMYCLTWYLESLTLEGAAAYSKK
jgi:hypothetical protein